MKKYNKEVGQICREARKACGKSVTAFATVYCECSKETIYKFEHGEIDSASLLVQYFRFFSDDDFKKLKELEKK